MSGLDKRVMLVCALLVLGVVVVFGQTVRYAFVNFDDDRYVYDNDHVKSGLTLSGLGYYLIHRHSYTYHPVTSISHMLDCQLFGDKDAKYGQDAGKHHAMNVLLHAAAAVGLFLVLRQMTGRVWPSALVAAVFAVHPLRVESVAWISERRDVLSGLFFVLALWAYVRYVRRPPSVANYVLLCLLFALGLLAKPMLVTLPLLLLLLDYWPLGRWRGRERPLCSTALCNATEGVPYRQPTASRPASGCPAPSAQDPPGLRRLLIEKIPLLVISLAACAITLYTQADGGAVQSLQSVSLAARIANTPIAYADYVGSFFWPQRLAVLYPHPCDGYDGHDAIIKGCLLIVATVVIALLWRRMPYLLVGWLWYLGMLVPVIGLLQVGGASMADRYTYLPQIGLAIAAVWTVTTAANNLRRTEFTPLRKLCGTEFTPFDDPEAPPLATGAALASNPRTQNERDSVVMDQVPLPALPPDAASMDVVEARRENAMNSVLRKAAPCVLALVSVAILAALAAAAWRQTAYWRNSETLWTRELSFPQYDNAVARYNFGLDLADHGRHREAVAQFEAAIAIDPKDEASRLNLGLSYEALDSADAAIRQYRAIVDDNAKSVSGHSNLARILQAGGDDRHAAEHLRAAHAEEPSNCEVSTRLALLLATSPDAAVRNGREALALARKAVELTEGKDAAALDALAAAEAETGDFEAARRDAQAALKLAATAEDKNLAKEIRPRLERYREGKPFRAKVVRLSARITGGAP